MLWLRAGEPFNHLTIVVSFLFTMKERHSQNKSKLKRAARDACEDEWKQIKIRHDNTVSAWKTECERLKAAGTQLKDLPMKP